MVAAPALKRALWPAAALLAGGALAVVALHGERPGAGLARYEPRGVMVAIPPERVTAVVVSDGARSWRFARSGLGWARDPGTAAAGADPTEAVEKGLRFLHGSAPQRLLEGADLAALHLPDAGLAPPRLTVRIWEGETETFAVDFGRQHPQGLAQYACVAGRPGILLLNRYVGGAWQELAAP